MSVCIYVELPLRMPAVRIQFVFLRQTAAGHRKIAEAEQEQLAGSGRSGVLASMMKTPCGQQFAEYLARVCHSSVMSILGLRCRRLINRLIA